MAYVGVKSGEEKINTKGINFFNDTAKLTIDYWSTTLSFKLLPATAGSDATSENGKNYDWKSRLQVVLTAQNALILARKVDELIEASKNNEAFHVGIQSAKVNIIYVSNGIEETGKFEPYVALFCDIDETRRPHRMLTFKFPESRIFKSFNPETGEAETVDEAIHSLYVFRDFLWSAKDLFGSVSQGVKVGDAAVYNADIELKQALASRNNVNYGVGQSFNYASRKDPFTSNGNNQPAPSITPTSVSSLDDIASLMNLCSINGIRKSMLNNKASKKDLKKIHIEMD